MAAIFKRQRPGGGRHPPPLAPTVSSFKPRAQWTNSGSSTFLYVNLPGFYQDQIQIKRDEKTRTVHIQGQRPLSAQTKARFNETYRVPDTCDMSKVHISFSSGLLTIEFASIVEGEKKEKAVQDQGKIEQRVNQEKIGPNGGGILRRKTTSKEETEVGTSQEKVAPTLKEEPPKTYKSVVEGKRELPKGSSQEKTEPKVKAGEAKPSLGGNEQAKEPKPSIGGKEQAKEAKSSVRGKEQAKQEKGLERKGSAQMGQQKTGQKLKEEEGRSTPSLGGSSKLKEHKKEEKQVEREEAAQTGQKKNGQRLKEEEAKRSPTLGGQSLKPKVPEIKEKVVEGKKDADISQNKTGENMQEKENVGKLQAVDANLVPKAHDKKRNGEIGQKLKKEEKSDMELKEEEKHTKPVVGGEARRTEKKIAQENQAEPKLKSKEGDETTELDVDALKSKQDEKNEMVSERENQERVEQKKIEETSLAKETGDNKHHAEVVEPETGPLLIGETKTSMDPAPAVEGRGMGEEESQTYDISLVNVGAAALVIMGFGAYVFVPLVKYFS